MLQETDDLLLRKRQLETAATMRREAGFFTPDEARAAVERVRAYYNVHDRSCPRYVSIPCTCGVKR